MSGTTRDKASLAMGFVLRHLARLKEGESGRPLFIACQGPQGSGKSYLADKLARDLSGPPHSLRVAQLSLDDLYLPHSSLVSLATSHPSNKLLSGRGQPGTHDIELGKRVLSALRSAQEGDTVQLPIYDKSAFDGEGDRSKDTIEVRGPLDVVIFEGWMTGFLPLTSSLSQRYDSLPSTAYAKSHPLESLREVDGMLEEYEELWAYIDAMIQLRPLEPTYTWTWRLQQEHAMKAKNGGVGMTDEQVHAFVDRYAPAYELWVFDGRARRFVWQDHVLQLKLDLQREVTEVSE